MTALDLARLQFGVTTVFHFIFVPVTIGLSVYVAICQTRHYRTGNPVYLRMTRYWGKFLLISFAVGVVTGIWQEFQFGMAWSNYSRFVGDVFGAPLAMEGLIAFFLESTFLGLWLFGRGRFSPRLHLATIWLVALGTIVSAAFILAANSWMQHPVGYAMRGGKAVLTNIGSVLVNPVFLYAFPHTVLAALITASALVVAISAWNLRRRHEVDLFRRSLRIALPIVLVATIANFVVGDSFAREILHVQPMKMAAAEGLFDTEKPAALSLFATGDLKRDPGKTNRNLKIPHLLSVLATLSWNGEVRGSKQIQAEYRRKYGPGAYVPIVGVAYWTWRAMIGSATLLILLALAGVLLMRKRRLERSPRFLLVLTWAVVLPFLANTSGWLLSEMGRQPWVVQGLLFTSRANSPSVSTAEVLISLLGLTVVYAVLGGVAAWLVVREAGHVPPPTDEAEQRPGADELALAY